MDPWVDFGKINTTSNVNNGKEKLNMEWTKLSLPHGGWIGTLGNTNFEALDGIRTTLKHTFFTLLLSLLLPPL